MSKAAFSSGGTISDGFRSAPGSAGGAGGRRLAPARRHVGQVALRDVDRLLVGRDEEVAAAGDRGVHLRPAHLLEADVLADHHLRHPRRAEVHRGVALAHHDDVAEGRDVGAAGGAGAEQDADLRDAARELDLVVEDPPRAAAAREHLDLVGDPRPGRVDEVDERHLELQRALLDAEDLLDRLGAPRARLDGRVVGHQRDPAAADQRQAGDDAVGAEALLLPVGEQPLLAERLRVDEPRDPLADRELALVLGLPVMALGAAGERRVERGGEIVSLGAQSPSSLGTGFSPE